MPTEAEICELMDNCTATWTDDYNGTGVAGRIFTSKTNGNSIFLPASGCCDGSSVGGLGFGYYWSASGYSSRRAWLLDFGSEDIGTYDYYRFFGFPVRGVCE